MSPSDLKSGSFAKYPPEGRDLASVSVSLLRELPAAFVPFLLKEIISYDWKFPVERAELDRQLTYLKNLPLDQRQTEMAPFAKLKLNSQLEGFDWVNSPAQYLEQLSAHLWATHQMDGFRKASEDYVNQFYAASPPEPVKSPRLGIVVVGKDVSENHYPLFRKLRRRGVYFDRVNPDHGLAMIFDGMRARASAHPVPYGHWYIDGGSLAPAKQLGPTISAVSYQALAPALRILSNKMRAAYESPNFGAEALRTMLARLGPEEVGLGDGHADPALTRFEVSLLTEGSGTQIFSTTFVQWAAREALRRAQPITLFARYAPRQRERPMNELLANAALKPEPDPRGSLIDADMGAYYTWLNLQRLPGADQSRFLVWFENHKEAVAVGPEVPAGTVDHTEVDLAGLLKRLS